MKRPLLQPLELLGVEDFKHNSPVHNLSGGHSNTKVNILRCSKHTVERFLPLTFVHPRLQLWDWLLYQFTGSFM